MYKQIELYNYPTKPKNLSTPPTKTEEKSITNNYNKPQTTPKKPPAAAAPQAEGRRGYNPPQGTSNSSAGIRGSGAFAPAFFKRSFASFLARQKGRAPRTHETQNENPRYPIQA